MNREMESAGMRPLAKAVTKSLENVRTLLREQVGTAAPAPAPCPRPAPPAGARAVRVWG